MDRGTTISALGHAGLILWVVLGDFFFAPDIPPPMELATVDLVSAADFAALEASAPKPKPAPEKPAEQPTVKPPKPVVADLPEPTPVEPIAEIDPTVPVDPAPQPIEAPEPVAPIAADEQPIPVPTTSEEATPRPIDRVAAVPVDDQTDTPEIADTVTAAVSPDALPDAPVVTEEKPAASPEEAAPVIVTEAVDTQDNAPQLAPTSSRRPQSRPEKPAEKPVEETPTETPPETPAEPQVADTTDADAEALAAALAEAVTEDPATTDPATDSGAADAALPEGPPMSAGQVEGLRVAINKCWNVGQLSSEALHVTVTIRVEMQPDGKPDAASIQMVGYEGGTDAAAEKAYEAGRRAVLRCAKDGYDLPPDQYDQWSVLNLVFDPSGMRLR